MTGGGWDLTLTVSGPPVEDLVDSGSSCLLRRGHEDPDSCVV